MKIFALRNDYKKDNKDLAYLIYYEEDKRFYIELPENITPWEVPIILSSFVRRGELTVNSYWSKIWVQQRIIPPDRQNLGQILRDNGIKEYDEYQLLMLCDGRCEQDECYLTPIQSKDLPKNFKVRYGKRIDFAIPLNNYNLVVFFRNGKVKKCSVESIFLDISKKNKRYADYSIFSTFKILPGGYGLSWGNVINVSNEQLFDEGKLIPLTVDDFKNFSSEIIITVSEAADILGCSRQNIDDLIKRGKLRFIGSSDKYRLLFQDEVLQRKWK